MLSQYSVIESGLNDSIMRSAVSSIDENRTYCLVGSNCQNYVDKVRREYNKIVLKKYGNSCGRIIE